MLMEMRNVACATTPVEQKRSHNAHAAIGLCAQHAGRGTAQHPAGKPTSNGDITLEVTAAAADQALAHGAADRAHRVRRSRRSSAARPLGKPSVVDSGNASRFRTKQAFPQIRPGREVWIARQNRCKGTGAFPPYHFGYGPQPQQGSRRVPPVSPWVRASNQQGSRRASPASPWVRASTVSH